MNCSAELVINLAALLLFHSENIVPRPSKFNLLF